MSVNNYSAEFDHAVINTRFDMDAAQQGFSQLGFSLTERGYHTLGSINHLMMFDTDYLELIGLPTPEGVDSPRRPGISDAPVGINGLVFKTENADQTFSHLHSVGLDGDPPNAFSRPVQMADGSHDAKFRTVHARRDAFPAGRVYFCEHQTPDLVWQPQWQVHANRVSAIAEMVVVSGDPRVQQERFASLLQTASQDLGDGRYAVPIRNGQLTLMSVAQYQERYQEMASQPAGRSDFYGALILRCADPTAVQALLQEQKIPFRKTGRGLMLRDDRFDCLLEMIEA